MRPLQYNLSKICDGNRYGSHDTQERRRRELDLIARQLRDLGYHHLKHPRQMGGRHVKALVNLWLNGHADHKPIGAGAIKNRLSSLRFVLDKVGRGNIMLSNELYGVPNRVYLPTESKAQALDLSVLDQINNDYVVMSLRLQAAFGLRREESIKFIPTYAYKPGQDFIDLKGSWCKGGKLRTVPITSDSQRILLAEATALAEGGSLIPAELKYVDQLRKYEYWCIKVGLHKTHGLRHHYLQERYEELSGLTSPVKLDALPVLTSEERQRDTSARLKVSQEAGHSRIGVTSLYVGAKRSKLAKDSPPVSG